jgi:hypothetical protein
LELVKDFGSECASAVVTLKQDDSDYAFSLNHEGNNFNQVLVTRSNGTIVYANNREGMKSGTTIKVKVNKAAQQSWKIGTANM